MSTERRQVSFRLDPEVHAALKELAGPVPLAEFVEGLVKRLVSGQGTGVTQRQLLPVRAPTPVQVVGIEKLEGSIAELRHLLQVAIAKVHEHKVYEELRDAELGLPVEEPAWWQRWLGIGGGHSGVSQKALQMAARDEAARELKRMINGSGETHG